MPELFPGELAPTTADRPPGPPPRPKLRRSDRRPDPGRWRDVVPPLLAEQVADSEQLVAHTGLVERVEQATTKLADLRAAHEEAARKDAEAEQAFAGGQARQAAPADCACRRQRGQRRGDGQQVSVGARRRVRAVTTCREITTASP
jgi:hypothetical protein